jgi:hypothetical protein
MIYWLFFGVIKLLILTFQDLFRKRMVDDRLNYFMMGVTVSLYSHYTVRWWFLFVLVAVSIGLSLALHRFKAMGEADLKTILWMFIGFGIINLYLIAWFAIVFIIIYLLYFSIFRLMALVFKEWQSKKKIPGYPIFLISFVFTYWVFVL